MCAHSDADQLAPGICINCMGDNSIPYAFLTFCAVFILAQMIRAYPFFLDLGRRLLA